jgi:hypothetical protein
MAKKLDQAKSNRSVIEGRLQRVEQFLSFLTRQPVA